MSFRFAFGRPPAVAAEAMVATSQPLATRAGLRMLERGGNAADAALAAAAVLCVTEPMSTGIGGDAFAIVWRDGEVDGLDAAGPAPRGAEPRAPVERSGPRSVTCPGAVAGWAALAERYGRLGLDACLADAIDVAERGFAVGAAHRGLVGAARPARWPPTLPPELAPAPAPATASACPSSRATLRAIAEGGARRASTPARSRDAICAASWLEEEDLAGYRAALGRAAALSYRGVEVLELPPPTQGVAALEALGLLERLAADAAEPGRCARLALEDALRARSRRRRRQPTCSTRRTSTAGAPSRRRRRRARRRHRLPVRGRRRPDGRLVHPEPLRRLRLGLVAPGTGVVLQNRGALLRAPGRVEPGRAPVPHDHPGHAAARRRAARARSASWAASSRRRRTCSSSRRSSTTGSTRRRRSTGRASGSRAARAPRGGLWDRGGRLERAGLPRSSATTTPAASAAGRRSSSQGDALVGGSDPRKDGYAAGF